MPHSAHTPAPSPPEPVRRAGELWILRPGPPEERSALVRAFAAMPLSSLLCAPGGDTEHAAAAFATSGLEPVRSAVLRPRERDESLEDCGARAWPLLQEALAQHARSLAILELDVLRGVLACALAMAPGRAHVLRVDPGCLALLRGDARAPHLRRLNVAAPEEWSGTPLPAPLSAP